MQPQPPGRLVSLDVFRGVTIASMILVNNPGSWTYVFPLFRHADWHGWTFTDLVFPFFLWMVGVSMTFSFARRLEQGVAPGGLYLQAARRGLAIFAFGLALNLIPRFDFAHVRIPGVLQRIGICYLIAAAIYCYASAKVQRATIVVLLVLYSVLMLPGGFAKESNFARDVDSALLAGHMWSQTKVWDPEGVISTLPAIATCLFGALAGGVIRSNKTHAERTVWLFFYGALLMIAGSIVELIIPVNKSLWTPSYALLMAGLASTGFAIFFWINDGLGITRGFFPFQVFGMNALALFVLSGMLAKILAMTGAGEWIWTHLYAGLAPDQRIGSVLYALTEVLALYGVAYLMYSRRIFIRL